ncbi:30S ribosomal protein S8 [Candidatus Gottesmanbacteria bacterium]|nr:30S ribosomal protein S8 [Candidatus Gottesmanbacteria bacterium]
MRFDPVADMISTIKNGYLAKKPLVVVSYSSFKNDIAKVLLEEKYLKDVEKKADAKSHKLELILSLRYENKKSVLSDIKQVSKTSLKVYVSHHKLPKVLGGLGTSVISTPQGVMSTRKAKKMKLGGEVICHIW